MELMSEQAADQVMAERREDAMQQMQHADCLYNAEQVNAMYDRMAEQICAEISELDPVVLCVMMGGFVPAAELIKRMQFAFEFDYLHATRYRGETVGGELVWKVSPGMPMAGRHVLVIDDILDEGHTLAAIIDALHGQGAASVRTAILLEKDHNRRDPELKADFLGGTIADRYVFGVGMDYKGYFRQLPAVYAVASE